MQIQEQVALEEEPRAHLDGRVGVHGLALVVDRERDLCHLALGLDARDLADVDARDPHR
jgi:hypothetical protein